jgi:hypothetical protein
MNLKSIIKAACEIAVLCALASIGLLGACSVKTAQWHPDIQGAGAWYDSENERMVWMRKSASGDGLFELERFSLDPKDGRIVYLGFKRSKPDAYACTSDDSVQVVIAGAVLVLFGKRDNGKSFTENYKAVNVAFIEKKAAEAERKRATLAAKRNPSLAEQQQAWILEMIVKTLGELRLP